MMAGDMAYEAQNVLASHCPPCWKGMNPALREK